MSKHRTPHPILPGHTPVKSSNLRSFSYDPSSKTLSVFFLSGQSRSYINVPPTTADAFAHAKSKGSFLHSTIIPLYQTLPDHPQT